MCIKDWKKDFFTIPNMLSLFRLILIPVYVMIYLNAVVETDYLIAGGILAVSCLTDMIDGQVARHFNMISTVGKVLDPLADKATQLTLIICLLIKHPQLQLQLLFILGLFVLKEAFQLIAGIVSLRKGQMLNGALISGKICTTVLFISLILMVLFPKMPEHYFNAMLWVDTAFLLIAFADYVRVYVTHGKMLQKLHTSEEDTEEE